VAKHSWNFEDAEYLERCWLLLADIYIQGKSCSHMSIFDQYSKTPFPKKEKSCSLRVITRDGAKIGL